MKAFYLLLAIVPLTLAAAHYPKPKPCECPLVKCPGEQPALCKCLNGAAVLCASRCGGKPKTTKCPTATKTSTTAPPTPLPTRNPICAGLTGIQCPEKGQLCIDNPFVKNCFIAADCPGICVGPFCGGIAGFPCPVGKVCLDVPNDGCDPKAGGRDCGGQCAIKEPFRADLP